MTTAQYITVRETSQILGVTEKKVMELVESEALRAYRIAGQFVRLRRSEVMNIRNTGEVINEAIEHQYTMGERVKDFFYYNDFYICSAVIIFALLYVIFSF